MKLKLLPSETFVIQTQDSIPVVRQKLLTHVEDSNTRRSSQDRAVFQGEVTENEFKISRIISSKNVFLPIICGRFDDITQETVIRIKMELDPFGIRFFYLLYAIGSSTALFMLVLACLKLLVDFKVVIISPLISLQLKSIPSELSASLIFGNYFITMLIKRIFNNLFLTEVKLTRKKLTQIFLGQMLSEDNEIVFH